MESFGRVLLSEIWRVFQKLSGFIWRVECEEALRKCMESLKVCLEVIREGESIFIMCLRSISMSIGSPSTPMSSRPVKNWFKDSPSSTMASL